MIHDFLNIGIIIFLLILMKHVEKVQTACVDSLRYPLPSIREIGVKVNRWAMKAVKPTFQKLKLY